jgi:methylthioribose-1-phosphate isomerase
MKTAQNFNSYQSVCYVSSQQKINTHENDSDCLILLDQTKLPFEVEYVSLYDVDSICEAITKMVVRGAPAIGIAAAYAVTLDCQRLLETTDLNLIKEKLRFSSAKLRKTRPTAVNLMWALDRMNKIINSSKKETAQELYLELLLEAKNIFEEDLETNKAIGKFGAELVPEGASIIHHCNTGGLATSGYGTALGIIRSAFESGKQIQVYLDETRPRLQGSFLSAWELEQLGIPYAVIVDSASGFVMKTKGIDMCFVGCDRVTSSGYVANKIGTYNLAIIAKAHNVPFYVAAPLSTIDRSIKLGQEIEIEYRSGEEISKVGGKWMTLDSVTCLNPAFDVTPPELITGFVTEKGVVYPPYEDNLRALFHNN